MACELFIWGLITVLSALILKISLQIFTGRKNRKQAVGFFHPYTNDGGGGERVLWCAVRAIQDVSPDLDCVVYTGDHDSSPDSLTARAIDRFGVKLLHPPKVRTAPHSFTFSHSIIPNSISIICGSIAKVVHLYKRKWIHETTYPRLTMIGQSLGSVYLSWEALTKFTPIYYFDTSGYAFTYPIARLFGCRVICYTHYPTISVDMLSRVRQRTSLYNNDDFIARRSV